MKAIMMRLGTSLKTMAGKAQESAQNLASQPTLCRFENMIVAKDLIRLSDWLLELYLKTSPKGDCSRHGRWTTG
jgi:hypothetical protein